MGSAVRTLSFNSLFIIFMEGKQLLALLTAHLIFKCLEIKVHLLKSWHRDSNMVDNPIQFSTDYTRDTKQHQNNKKSSVGYFTCKGSLTLLPSSLSLQLWVSACRAWAGLALKFRFFRANLLAGGKELVVSSLPLPHLLLPLSFPRKALQQTRATVSMGWN